MGSPEVSAAVPAAAAEAGERLAAGPDPAGLAERAAALEALQAGADEHASRRLSARTRRLYAGDWAHFAGWCALAGLAACPAAVDTVRWYLTDLEATVTDTGQYQYGPPTLRRRLAAIAHGHREAGQSSPTRDPAVTAVLSGIERARQQPPRRLHPLLLEDLRTILGSLDYTSWPAGVTATRDAFVLLAGFAGALRRAELAALTVHDVTVDREDGLHVRIRASKTDQTGRGAIVVLPYGQHPSTCPVCAYTRWSRLLEAANHSRPALMTAVFTTPAWAEWTHICCAPAAAGESAAEPIGEGLPAGAPLLRAVRRGGQLADTAVSGDALHVMVKRRADAAGIPGPVGFHSLRAGFVTQARRNGAGYRAVRRQTRHGSDAMVEVYDRDQNPLGGNAVTELGL